LSDRILKAAEKTIPLKSQSNGTRQVPFWNESCKEAVNKRKLAEKILKKNNTFHNIFAFNDARKEAKRAIELAKQQYWENYVSTLSNDSKLGSIWNTIKSLSGHKTETNIPLIVNKKALGTNMEKANAFAQEFQYVTSNENQPTDFSSIRKQTANNYLISLRNSGKIIPEEGSVALNMPIGLDEVDAALEKLNKKSAPGPDNITMSMLYHLPPIYKTTLLSIFNQYFETKTLPPCWNHALITPILKSGADPKLTSSYRV